MGRERVGAVKDPTSFGEFLVQAIEVLIGLIVVLGGFGIGAAVAIIVVRWALSWREEE